MSQFFSLITGRLHAYLQQIPDGPALPLPIEIASDLPPQMVAYPFTLPNDLPLGVYTVFKPFHVQLL